VVDAQPTACIDELLGPKAKAKGARCPCLKCSPQMPVEEKANAEFNALNQPTPEAEPPRVARKPHNGKMAAANDQEESDEAE